jgi:trehalose-6-phosphate synthase
MVKAGNQTVDARLALWAKTHALFVSTLKDGLYLTCFEYIMVKHRLNDFENSALVLSEFTGCSS